MAEKLLDILEQIRFQEIRKHPFMHPYLCSDELFIDLDVGIAELEALKAEVERLQIDVERLNQMIRETGQGQGAIDAYVAQCEEVDRLEESEELAWGLIANAYGGNWDLASETSGWKDAAVRWRDNYHAHLPSSKKAAAAEEVK